MSSAAIKAELARLHPDTVAKGWKRRSRMTTAAGTVRIFEHEDGRLVETVEAADGTVTATSMVSLRADLDRAINAAFRQPLMDNDGYESWNDLMDDYGLEHAGQVLSNAMIVCAGPTPDRFYKADATTGGERLYDNLCGLENVEYVEHEGRATYEMDVDRSGLAPRIRVFQIPDGFDLEMVD